MGKPVIIDYPANRKFLKSEFGKIAAAPELSQSVAMPKEVLQGLAGKRLKGQKARKSPRKQSSPRPG